MKNNLDIFWQALLTTIVVLVVFSLLVSAVGTIIVHGDNLTKDNSVAGAVGKFFAYTGAGGAVFFIYALFIAPFLYFYLLAYGYLRRKIDGMKTRQGLIMSTFILTGLLIVTLELMHRPPSLINEGWKFLFCTIIVIGAASFFALVFYNWLDRGFWRGRCPKNGMAH